MPTILISAGDASGEAIGAELVRALSRRVPEARFVGLGGKGMAEAGVECVADQSALAISGFGELVPSLRGIYCAWRSMIACLDRESPELVVLIDSGGFNLPFARMVRRRSKARVLYYVAPQVWAWRSGRLRKLAARTDRIAVVLPFEETFYRAAGVSVDAVGHPILDRPVATRPVADARRSARHALGIDPGVPVIGFYPGSRRNEIARHLPLQFEAIERLVADRKDLVALEIVIAVAPSIDLTRIEGIAKRFANGRKLHFVTDAMLSMDAIDVALAKPGTVTLELLLRERPMVVMARTGRLTGAIVRRGLNVSYLALPNLIAEAEIVPECIQDRATPDRIASALAPLLGRALGGRDEGDEEFDGAEMNALSRAALDQVEAMREARTRLGESGATDRAAAIAEELLGTPRT